ncbi:hypothetical protein BH09ACT1_BH09ACT1_04750 [soil metagenome]
MTNPTTGFDLNPIQLRAAIATPSKWRDMLVAGTLADGTVELRDLQTDAAVILWHHADLTGRLSIGEPVSFHTAFDVLALGSEYLSVRS